MSERIDVEESSGNVWADLGYADAEERMAKALLSRWIDKRIQSLGLTQLQAAERMGVSQPDVSNLRRGHVSGFSLERLVRLINSLGHNVRISVEPEPAERGEGHLLVAAG